MIGPKDANADRICLLIPGFHPKPHLTAGARSDDEVRLAELLQLRRRVLSFEDWRQIRQVQRGCCPGGFVEKAICLNETRSPFWRP